ncbi:MAG: lipoate--protein ligase family protein [Chloroflexota bacterium]
MTEPLPVATWRLLITDPPAQDGATNMAIDEAILEGVAQGESPPTLRFYTWRPACVSVGYSQSLRETIDLDACHRDDITWVRRPTGGRAILHSDELTYSIVLPAKEKRVLGGVVESYRRLSQGLLAGLRLLGLEVAQAEAMAARPEELSAACFDAPSHYEITTQGKKLVGSAQVRRQDAVLQHGALPLSGDVTRLVDYLRLPQEERAGLRAELGRRAITLQEALGRSVSPGQVAQALAEGFAGALNLRLEHRALAAREQSRARQLRQQKYASDTWNLHK